MPKRYNETVQNTFVKGLITERGELTFPDDASIDESNCDLLKTGARRRRLGLDQESSGVLSTEAFSTADTIFTVHQWNNVGEEEGVNFVVVQMGGTVWFYEQAATGALSANRVDTTKTSGVEYSIDLTAYERRASVLGAASAPIQVASIKGVLVIVSKEIDAIYVERNKSSGAFTVNTIDFKFRDYKWQRNDLTQYQTESAGPTVDVERYYDTRNCGWNGDKGEAALSDYISAKSAYPPLTLPWYSGKDATGAFDVTEWEQIFGGSSLITNGSFVIDLYEQDRGTAVGLTAFSTDWLALLTYEDARFSTVTAYSGRVFYSGMVDSDEDNASKVYFTQLLESGFSKIGSCYQVNDPTSEDLSDLLDTDGGYISIPDAYNIRKLHTYGPDLYVFAENGVWRVSGVDDVFRATEYSVSKIGEDGIVTANSFVSASGRPYWWSNGGIFTIAVDPNTGQLITQNLSVSTIQSLFDDIGAAERGRVQASYDDVTRRVFWAYPSSGETNENKLNELIIWDETLGAFIPWSVSDETTNTKYMVGLAFTSGNGTSTITYNVVDSNGDNVVDSSGNNVVVTRTGASLSSSQLKVLYRDPTGAVSFADFADTSFLDWGTANYVSYAETAYNFLGSAMVKKNVPYILTFMKTTETGFQVSGSGYSFIRPSSLKMTSRWDFRTTAQTAEQQAYRLKYPVAVDTGDLGTWDYPETVVQSRLKVRGKGRVLVLRWESEQGYDFHLLGWATLGASNDRL